MGYLNSACLLFVIIMSVSTSYAQGPPSDPPRSDDHFWRQSILIRIDLKEKINRPFGYGVDRTLYSKEEPQVERWQRKGLVHGLIEGLRNAQFLGVWPDSLDIPMTYYQFNDRMLDITGEDKDEAKEEGGQEGDALFGEELGGDSDLGGDIELGSDFNSLGDEANNNSNEKSNSTKTADPSDDRDLYHGLEFTVELIVDRIFDKNKSSTYYDIQYLRFIWVDPSGTLPSEPIIAFNWNDIKKYLDKVQWTNRHNSAKHLSAREALELLKFNGIIADIENQFTIRTLEQAAKRKRRMVQFEHHLWEY